MHGILCSLQKSRISLGFLYQLLRAIKWPFRGISGTDDDNPHFLTDIRLHLDNAVKGGGYPDTWTCWLRTPSGEKITPGGTATSKTVIVDCKGTLLERGGHIDLKIDNGRYKPVASPHTITGLSDGAHTIYLRAVDKDGKADPTPAKWRFTVINDDNNDD
jgi:hypothetical protein